MAFNSGIGAVVPFGNGVGAFNSAQIQTGPNLEEIQTEAIGFQTLGGDTKIRLLPSPWPADALPTPTASLLSIASKKGLVAAAGPDSVVVASTGSIRQAFTSGSDSESNIKSFSPQLTLNIGMRVSQVAFSADENFLVISAEVGGGLGIYDVQSLLQGSTQPAFELSTNGTPLRTVIPNPTPEKAELFAVVTANGELMMANLKTRQFFNGAQGQTMKDGVSCVSWSTRGKQLVAGLGNGTCSQMTPEGEAKEELPKPPGLQGDQHVSSISWLENNLFLIAHTPSSFDPGTVPPTVFNLLTRQTQPQRSFIFQALPEPCAPFATDRSPPYLFIQRLKDFPPNLQDVIVVASTASIDVGLFCRSKAALTSDPLLAADKITNVFTTTTMADDSRRAQLPMTEDFLDTSPIGLAFDFSSTDKVSRPLPGEEMNESSVPLPALMILNNDGVLSSWWLVYADSIRQGTTYPGLTVAEGQQPQAQAPGVQNSSPFGGIQQPAVPAFGQNPFGAPTSSTGNVTMGKPSAPAFGSAGTSGSTTSGAFGSTSGLGRQQSPWTTTGANNPTPGGGVGTFGSSPFGSTPVTEGPAQSAAFGTTGGMGNRASPWGPSPVGSTATSGSTFGQSGSLGMRTGNPFGNTASANPFGPSIPSAISTAKPTGGFASFASGPSFADAAAKAGGESDFAKATTGASFGSGMDTDSSFGGTPRKKEEVARGMFSGANFTLGSTFRGDGTAGNDRPNPALNSLFGSNFSQTLEQTQRTAVTAVTEEADMNDSASEHNNSSQGSPAEREIITPAAKAAYFKFPSPGTAPPANGGFFGTQSQSEFTPAVMQSSSPATSSWGRPTPITTTPKETPRKPEEDFSSPLEGPLSPIVKVDPEDDAPADLDENLHETPLPPESTSKLIYSAGDCPNSPTSASKSLTGDDPLPPDFLPSKGKVSSQEEPRQEQSALPADGEDDGLDDEGSGVDVAQEISPITDPSQSPKITPGSSFGGSFDKSSFDRSPVGGLFASVKPHQPRQNAKSLFGEIGKTSAPDFPPPTKPHQSPRSPSPVRPSLQNDILRSENVRSISVPGRQTKGLTKRRAPLHKAVGLSGFQKSAEDDYQQELSRAIAQNSQRSIDEQQNLSDNEDEKVREELATEVEGTKILNEFLAHQDYVGNVDKSGVPGQIEKVYRDINSMIDTLGLNARSLKAFTKGNSEMVKDGGRVREDLEDDDWCLIEIGELQLVVDSLSQRLENGRIEDVQAKLDTCRALQKTLSKIEIRSKEIGKLINAKSDPDQIEAERFLPLNPEQVCRQFDLRKDFGHIQKLISEAEEGITMLRTNIAAHDSSNSRDGNRRKPTVEAVTNTIMKMTSMVEKKSGDIDFLETQMRRLRFSSANESTSRGSSPFATNSPSPLKQKVGRKLQGSILQKDLVVTPQNASSVMRESMSGLGRPKNPLSAITAEEAQRYGRKIQQRQEINKILKEAFMQKGPRIRSLDEV